MMRDRFANPRLLTAVLALVAAMAAASSQANAQDGQSQTPGADRVVALFDFEEPDNPFEFPGSFFRAQSDPAAGIDRPGFPIFNKAVFDFEVAHSGDASVRLPIRRGSVSLRLRPGVVPVFREADYRISCMVRGQDLVHSKFRLVVRYLDTNGKPIADTDIYSGPILPSGIWQQVEIIVPGGQVDGAAFLQIDAEVVQPRQLERAILGNHQVWEQDFIGNAWVDDILIEQLPRLTLQTQSKPNIVMAPEIPELQLLVRDLMGHDLSARVVVRNHMGVVVEEQTRVVESSQIPSVWELSISKFGWYTVEAHISSAGHEISVVPLEFCWVPHRLHENSMDSAVRISESRFGITIENYESGLFPLLDEVTNRLGVGSLILGAWSDDTDPEMANAAALALGELSDSTSSRWSHLTIALSNAPLSVRKLMQVDRDEVLRVVSDSSDENTDFVGELLEPLLDRLGQFVRRWRIGPLEGDRVFWLEDPADRLTQARAEFSLLVPGPILDLPWSSDLSFDAITDAEALGAISVHFPSGTGVRGITDVLERWSEAGLDGKVKLSLVLGADGSGTFGPGQASTELVKRMVYIESTVERLGLAVSPDVEIVMPWTWSESLDPVFFPNPEAAAWRATIDRLQGRRIAANLAFQPGMHVYLLTPIEPNSGRGGALVAWNDTAPLGEAVVNIFLGDDDVTAIDIWGNKSGTISPNRLEFSSGGINLHEIPISTEPVFIEGIDVDLALFTSSIRLDNPVLQAVAGPRDRIITLTNPWSVSIDGSLIISEPSPRLDNGQSTGWVVSPRVIRFTAAPGESIEIPISIEFTTVELAGQKQFVVDVQLSAGPTPDRIRSASMFEIVLDGVELDVRAVVSPNNVDLAVEAVVTNTSLKPLDLDLFASARGFPRQNSTISQLAPGSSVVRRFMYTNGAAKLLGNSVYVGVEDPVRQGRFNKSVKID